MAWSPTYSTAHNYNFQNIQMTGIHAKSGGAFYLAAAVADSNQYHTTNIALNTVTIKDSFSFQEGMFYAKGGLFTVTITGATFESNTGTNAEADMRIENSGTFQVSSSTFTKFSSSGLNAGQSITIGMAAPFTYVPTFSTITFKCSTTAFVAATYEGFLSTSGQLTKKAPIRINSGKVATSLSTFSNCFSSSEGGVIYVGSGAVSVLVSPFNT